MSSWKIQRDEGTHKRVSLQHLSQRVLRTNTWISSVHTMRSRPLQSRRCRHGRQPSPMRGMPTRRSNKQTRRFVLFWMSHWMGKHVQHNHSVHGVSVRMERCTKRSCHGMRALQQRRVHARARSTILSSLPARINAKSAWLRLM